MTTFRANEDMLQKPYGVDFKAYRYIPETDWFDEVPNYELRRTHTQFEC